MPETADVSLRREVYSVSRLNRAARELLESSFPRLWVEGEVSNLSRPASGHLYFTLKDAQAQVSCALFRNRALRVGFRPENGTQVLVQAEVSLYEPRGNYQLIVSHMEEAGDGALRRTFEQLKQRLHDEGLFDVQHKQPLPRLPRCIGVITSPTGAAIRDVLTVLRRRFPVIPVIVYPVPVQGAAAAQKIVAALQTAQRRGECDVLLLTRGGGSLEDLWPFNEEAVARALFACTIPVVSAVGHEIDVVITDFVADQRAATPSAAAELLSPDQHDVSARMRQLENRLHTRLQRRLQRTAERIAWLTRRVQHAHPGRRLQQQAQRLDELDQRLRRGWGQRLTQLHARLAGNRARLLLHSPARLLQNLGSRADQLGQRLRYGAGLQFSRRREKLAVLSRALETVSPLATLQRGYSITLNTTDGAVLLDSAQARVGDTLETRLAHGRVYSRITDSKPS
jgi:exodeoxyribonuclease VII large subunit